MFQMLARMLFPKVEVVSVTDMSVRHTLNACDDFTPKFNDSFSDCGSSVDFGTLFEAKETLTSKRSECSDRSSSNGSIHQCYFTERTKYVASQSTFSNRTFCKKRRLENLEQDTNSPSVSLRDDESLDDTERLELLSSKHLYAGREILNRWILLIVRIIFHFAIHYFMSTHWNILLIFS
jgi:hypothetical protein